jgi:probable O-glycosylation ligase (exosortase A-associated)
MRDLLLLAVIVGGIPFILRSPWIGVIFWAWVSVMNPHRLAWGFAYDLPIAQIVAAATVLGMFLTKDDRRFKGGAAAWVLLAFVLWMVFTTQFALVPSQASPMLERVLKIQLLNFVALLLLYRREHVHWLVLIVTLSIGFYAVKGGAFTLATLGNYRVWGPANSFIFDNNALALATVMTIPLWAYLFIIYRDRWWRWGIVGAVVLSAASALGSHSRGALLAIIAMSLFFWLKSHRKVILGATLVVLASVLVSLMPQHWDERMSTIAEYQEDESAQGRIETWHMMYDIAADRPLFAGGFEPYAPSVLAIYRPEYQTVRSAHSIYFQVLGEHGFVGLGLFLLFWALIWGTAQRIIRDTKDRKDAEWAFWMARMIQVSLLAYFVGGAFLNLAYWDMPYYLAVALLVTRYVVARQPAEAAPDPVAANEIAIEGSVAADATMPVGAGSSTPARSARGSA